MPNRDELNALLTPFDPIFLSQMDDVALLSRFEVKYVLPMPALVDIRTGVGLPL